MKEIDIMEIHNGKWTVYVHINKINGKKYVGITSRKLSYRWNSGKGYKSQPKFYNAICKYGWDNFEHEIISSNLTENEAKKFEILLIDKLDAVQNGYNQTYGGEGLNGYKFTEEAKDKIREKATGRKLSKETKEKIRKAHLGIPPSEKALNKAKEVNTGSHPSLEIREKISKACRRGKHPAARKVVFEDIVFDCIRDCSDYAQVSYNAMKMWLENRSLPPKFIIDKGFGYYGEEPLKKYSLKNKRKNYIVLCEDMEFSSVKECAEYIGVKPSNLIRYLSGERKMPDYLISKNIRYKDE